MPFKYTPLQNPASEIRLLKIHQTPEEYDLLVVDITAFPIATAPPYAAISYTWGRPVPVVRISLNGAEFSVRKNCHYALWQSQLHNTELLIWIDSICINQDNLEEKNVQVRIMGEIFRKAKLVFASLGPHEGDSAFLCGAIANLELRSSGDYRYNWDNVTHGKPRKWQTRRMPKRWVPWDVRKPPPPLYWKEHLDAFPHLGRARVCAERFLRRPFFSRLWILQELALAQEVFVMCGPELLLWSSLACFFGTLNLRPRDKYSLQNDIFYTVQRFGYGKQKQTMQETSFLKGLATLRCSDLRDRIFGTLTLVQWCDDTDLIFPDYNMSIYEVAAEILKQVPNGTNFPSATLKVAGQLLNFLRLTDDDVAAYRSIPLEETTASGRISGRLSSVPNTRDRSGDSNTHVRNYYQIPNFCHLLPTNERFSLTMNESKGILWTEVLEVFEEVASQEMTFHAGHPQLQRLVMNGVTTGLLCSDATRGDVLQHIGYHTAGSVKVKDIDPYLVFRPNYRRNKYTIVGPAILGSAKPPLYHAYKPTERAILDWHVEGTMHLHPNDAFAQSIREKELRENLKTNAYHAVMTYLTTSFTQEPGSSFFVPYPR